MITGLTFIYNEEAGMEKVLQSIKPYVQEIIVYDLESTDSTFDICKKYTDKVYKVPYLLCGDSYKQELVYRSKGDWILWFYGDEVFPEYTAKSFEKFTKLGDRWNVFAFMRHEYMDNIRLNFRQDNKIIEYGTAMCPNYQCRLIKNDNRIQYSELVHAEFDGKYETCSLPSEYYMEHRKTSQDQEFDNWRLYVYYKMLVWKYGDTNVEPYKKYVVSYRKIIKDSEEANLKGVRKILLAEEFWWEYDRYKNLPRISLEEFKKIMGMEYKEFLEKGYNLPTIKLNNVEVIKDRAVVETEKNIGENV